MMIHRSILDLFTYWNLVRGYHFGPLRSEIEPGPIRHLLTDLFILERERPAPAFRLAGTRLCAAFGRELRSEALTLLFAEQDRATIARVATGIMEHTCPVLLDLSADSRSGRSVGMTMLLLPVRSSPGRYDRLLGALVADSQPVWLGADPVATLTITRSRILSQNGDFEEMLAQPLPPSPPPAGLNALLKRVFSFGTTSI